MSPADPRTAGGAARAAAAFAGFLALVAGAAALGARFQPGSWYEALEAPPLTPPDWLFAPVWTLLYLAIATAGWLVWRERGAGAPLALWGGQLALNAAWSFLFFGLQRPGLALLDIAALVFLVGATTVAFFRVRPTAGWLFLPYAAWVAFAAYLNAGFWLLNR